MSRAAGRELSLWRYVWKLLHFSWLISFNNFRRAKRPRQIGYIVVALFVLAIAAGAFVISRSLLRFLSSPELAGLVDPAVFLSAVPVLIATIAFMGILVFSFGVLLQALYLAGDMDFLLSAPVPIRAVFLAKLLQAILPNLGLTLLFGLPVLYGLGAAGGYNLFYYPLVVVVLTALVLAAAGMASVLVMSIVRLFPARSIAEVLALVGSALSLLCSQLQYLVQSAGPSREQVSRGLGLLALLNAPWSPFAWAGRGLVALGEGNWFAGTALLFLTLALAGAIFAVTLNTAERLYYTGWARMATGTRRKRAPRTLGRSATGPAPHAAFLDRLIPQVVRGIVAKDALVLRRDLRNMSQFLSPLMLGIIYAVLLVRGGGEPPAGRGEGPAWFMQTLRNLLAYGNVAIALFVGWSLMTRLGLIGFSQEGKYYWLLKSAPVSAGQLLMAKFLTAYLPTLILGWAFLILTFLLQRGGPASLLFGLPVVALCTASGTGISLAFGVTSANLKWQDPRRMMPGATGCLSLLAVAGVLAVSLVLFFGPPIGFPLLGWPREAGQVIGLVLGGAVSVACAFLPLRLARDRVPRIGEE
jgi:ABC-2 type transport system permease protein